MDNEKSQNAKEIDLLLSEIVLEFKSLNVDKKIDFMRNILKTKEDSRLAELKEIFKKHDIESIEDFLYLYENQQIHFAKTDFQTTHEFICRCGVKLILKDSDENAKFLKAYEREKGKPLTLNFESKRSFCPVCGNEFRTVWDVIGIEIFKKTSSLWNYENVKKKI